MGLGTEAITGCKSEGSPRVGELGQGDRTPEGNEIINIGFVLEPSLSSSYVFL